MNTIKVLGTPLYQWEIGRKIQILPLRNLQISAVHICSVGDAEALVVKPKSENGIITADIPNILLQNNRNILVYVVDVSTDYVETLRDCIIPVRIRPRPSDYVYTETEVLSYETLAKRINDLEQNGVSGERIEQVVSDYLKENPVQTGATKEEAEQIAQNKGDIADLKKDKLNASELPTAINEALKQAKDSGEFNGKDGKDGVDGEDGYTPQKNIDYFDGKDGQDGLPGADGITPHIGSNGNWFIGNTDTGKPSRGVDGKDGQDGSPGKDGANGQDYVLTDADKREIAGLAADLVDVPEGSGGNVELDTTLTQSGKAADAKAVGDKIAEITGISLIEPAEDDIPKIFFGGALQQTKDEKVVPFRYISKTEEIIGFAEIKAQGNNSMSYPKKNQTVKMFKDADCTEKLKVDFKGWGKQNKHVYKANWIDLTHARNVVSARLWGDVVKSRANYEELPELLRTSPNQGAVDGFPVKVYAGGVYQGRYTLNIPKDAWMANMDKDLDTHCILCGENYVSGCFRASANINESDWTDEIHDTVPASIKTRWNQVISFVMNSTDEEFRANLNQYFYVDSLIDYYLFGLASCGLDAFGKNQLYMTYDGQKWIATMYDMDSTWGLWWTGASFVATDYDRSEYQDFKDGGEGNLLYIRLEKLFYEELKARWAELRSGALSIENIINRFERFVDIAPAELVSEDYASTTADGKFTGIPSKTTSTIQQIRAYAVARHTWCDTYVADLTGDDVEPDEPIEPDVPVEPDVPDEPDEPDEPGDAEIDYTLNPLEGVTWELGSYTTSNGNLRESTTDYRTDKFELQNCVYDFQMGSGNSWAGIFMWNENGEYVGGIEHQATPTIGKFIAKSGWKYAIKVNGDASAVSLMPVDQSANASGISTVTVDGASETWVKSANNGSEVTITDKMASAGFAATASASEVRNKINKCSHCMFLSAHLNNFMGTGAEAVMFINCYQGGYYLVVGDVSVENAPALVGTLTIN